MIRSDRFKMTQSLQRRLENLAPKFLTEEILFGFFNQKFHDGACREEIDQKISYNADQQNIEHKLRGEFFDNDI